MPRGDNYHVRRVSMRSSRGVVIHHLGQRRHSPMEDGEREFRCHYPPGVQRISNAQLPMQRHWDNELRCAQLQGML